MLLAFRPVKASRIFHIMCFGTHSNKVGGPASPELEHHIKHQCLFLLLVLGGEKHLASWPADTESP